MGCVQSIENRKCLTSNEIDKKIQVEGLLAPKKIKLLLLGPGGSGKSTLAKQVKIIHAQGFSLEEKKAFKPLVFANTLYAIANLMDAMDDNNIGLALADNYHYKSMIQAITEEEINNIPSSFPLDLANAIKMLWRDEGTMQCFQLSKCSDILDCSQYYFEAIDRFVSPSYIPTEQDILRVRTKSTGIVETDFILGDVSYCLLDVGGQRSERKKWVHCFENVGGLIFTSAISVYDETLIEDDKTNQLEESLNLFDSIVNSEWFRNSAILLFLNKTDVFRRKISISPMSKFFPEFKGGTDFDSACEFILQLFLRRNRSHSHIYVHFTCATDTHQVKYLMRAMNDIILRNNLKDQGFI